MKCQEYNTLSITKLMARDHTVSGQQYDTNRQALKPLTTCISMAQNCDLKVTMGSHLSTKNTQHQ